MTVNKCRRCDRELSDPNALFGWRCAEYLGLSGLSAEVLKTHKELFDECLQKTVKMLGSSKLRLTEDKKLSLAAALFKMHVANELGNTKAAKQAQKDSFRILNENGFTNLSFAEARENFKNWFSNLEFKNLPKPTATDSLDKKILRPEAYAELQRLNAILKYAEKTGDDTLVEAAHQAQTQVRTASNKKSNYARENNITTYDQNNFFDGYDYRKLTNYQRENLSATHSKILEQEAWLKRGGLLDFLGDTADVIGATCLDYVGFPMIGKVPIGEIGNVLSLTVPIASMLYDSHPEMKKNDYEVELKTNDFYKKFYMHDNNEIYDIR